VTDTRRASELISDVAWRLRRQETISGEGLRISDGKHFATSEGSKVRLFAFFRVEVPESGEDPSLDYSGALNTTLQQQRIRGLFEGLRRASVPFLYAALMNQAAPSEKDRPVLEFDLVVGTWVDGRRKENDELSASLEQRASILSATLSVALPHSNVVRLVRGGLAHFLKTMLLPEGRSLHQLGSASTFGSLCTFDRVAPAVGAVDQVPEFYVPNSAESGRDGILLGAVKSGSGEFHDFRLQTDDLRRHVSVLGMTGSGKSTTGATIVRQVAETGLPVMVLDWHNEYGRLVSSLGGKTVAPGKDDFTMNPLEVGPRIDLAEHVAMVCDIFSDIYHFTHPQAYMFRNALQKTVGNATADESPNIATLVKAIEAYPLRSAYDNETKVALLRRLVPLTQGQAGKALGGSGQVGFHELLSGDVCFELGHMRDIQARTIFADVILKMTYEEKVTSKASLDHMTVVEEARNVAPARRPEDPPSVGERMISELRKFGEAMMFVAQFPSHIAAEVTKNSGTKIVHRLAWPDDVTLIGDSLSLNRPQRQHLTRLKVGEAVVGVARIQKPVLVQVKANYLLDDETSLPSFGAES
jgi:Helicase HerA, central domain